MKQYVLFACLFLLASFSNQKERPWRKIADNPEHLHMAVKQITDIMVHDIYAPPVASRTYAYISVAGYEAARHADTAYQTLAGQLQGLQPLPLPDPEQEYSFPVASVTAVLTTGKALVISEARIDTFYNNLLRTLRSSGMPPNVLENSIAYGKLVAKHILAWAANDNFKQTRSFPKYDLTTDEASWKPTPPAYMKAVEPHWGEIRTFLIDSAQQFRPLPTTPFSKEKGSKFYKEAKAVHDAGLKLTPLQREISLFWDCNPFKMNVNGHVMYATKKISPGGHWINITSLACRKTGADFVASAEAYTWVSLAIADGFISCWEEKYRSNVIRPETYINQYISTSWMPLLQTPPFPEYTSGHSVISTASASILTNLFGGSFAFTDSTELEFGLPARRFQSFAQAAEEAAISRFYGGIHYMPAIVNGQTEGKKLALFYRKKLATRGASIAGR